MLATRRCSSYSLLGPGIRGSARHIDKYENKKRIRDAELKSDMHEVMAKTQLAKEKEREIKVVEARRRVLQGRFSLQIL